MSGTGRRHESCAPPVQERTVTWKFVAFKIIFDVWQLLNLTINPQYGWAIDGNQM